VRTTTPKTIYLKDYEPPHYAVKKIDLTVRIFDTHTEVVSSAVYKKNKPDAKALVLDGENMTLKNVRLNGKELASSDYTVDAHSLTIPDPGSDFALEITTHCDPANNTSLEGLYKSGTTYCTQCESQGFRWITYFPDRPDIMTVFSTRIEADEKKFPVLLSNGNPVDAGRLEKGRHYTLWHDPFPKPCYLFALVAGDLKYIQDSYTTMTGRIVDLRIYVKDGDQPQCSYAMESLKRAMAWDESAFGREYQHDRFNIVAVSDFNFGAMENTSLNIFNTALVLAHLETATDSDFYRVEGVIAHEYFHNWTGNRITCRDWFQLSLKEGFTVFRDQEFSADMNSRPVQRIDDVSFLRSHQFPEDGGPLAHPIRPDNYIEINNFYTTTVYEKGAEVIRMQKTLLGNSAFRKGSDLYFDRYDGNAVTCDDFVKCMEDASGMDLTQFKLWYSQAGTPEVSAKGRYDESSKTYHLTLKQALRPTPGQPDKQLMHIPIAVGLISGNGDEIKLEDGQTTQILHLTESEQEFTFRDISSKPVPSILRNFSAPVKLTTDLSDDDLRFLLIHDTDGFNRWESAQNLALRIINAMLDAHETGKAESVDPAFLSTIDLLLDQCLDSRNDKALLARMLTLPEFSIIAQARRTVDPDAIHHVVTAIEKAILRSCGSKLQSVYDAHQSITTYSPDPDSMGQRALKSSILRFLCADQGTHGVSLAKSLYDSANNMTDRIIALSNLVDTTSREREDVLEDFYDRFKSYPLVIDKWFSFQARAVRPTAVADVRRLAGHPDFTLKNPNRVRSLYGAFAMGNPVYFHNVDGSGYALLAEAVKAIDPINPHVSSRLMTAIRDWKRFTPERQHGMKAILEQVLATPNISTNTYEIASKTLSA
jgi:aminopeptidase N